jgi:hypothetical protein
MLLFGFFLQPFVYAISILIRFQMLYLFFCGFLVLFTGSWLALPLVWFFAGVYTLAACLYLETDGAPLSARAGVLSQLCIVLGGLHSTLIFYKSIRRADDIHHAHNLPEEDYFE